MDDHRRSSLRRAAVAVAVVGGLLAVVGGVGLALDGDDDAEPAVAADRSTVTRAERRQATTPTSAAPRSIPPVATTLPLRTRVDAFFTDWATALRAGDTAFLVARLHPAVIDRYGDAACRATLGALRFPNASTQVLSTDAALAPWDWTTDGRTTRIADAVGLRLRRTEDGSTFTESDAHVALAGNEVRWFTDCGTPKEA